MSDLVGNHIDGFPTRRLNSLIMSLDGKRMCINLWQSASQSFAGELSEVRMTETVSSPEVSCIIRKICICIIAINMSCGARKPFFGVSGQV